MVFDLAKVNSLDKSKRTRGRIDQPRKMAYEIFHEVINEGGYSNLLLNQRLSSSHFEPRDKAFVTELVYGSIRQIGRNDFIASRFSSRTWSEVDSGIVDIVRIGLYQLFDMRIPTHAAVSTSVDLARVVLGESQASYVNALMRKISSITLDEHLIEIADNSISSLAIRYSHPEWIISAYRDHISDIDEVIALLESNNRAVRPTLVAWPTKANQNDLYENGCEPTRFSSFGAYLNGVPNEFSLIKERRVGVQDEGSQLVASLFATAAKEFEPWLDLCAGPGGKAALLSYLAKETFIANEVSEIRADLVRKVVKPGSKVIAGDGREIDFNLKDEEVNAVIADVPCTGIGALRRRPEVRWRRKTSDLPNLTKLQFELAQSAINKLPVDGVFGYATCSPHFAETIAQCMAFEKHFPIEKIAIDPYLPEGLTDATRNGFMQLWPHRHQTDAMFLALYRKR